MVYAYMMTFGQKLRELRKDAGVSQDELRTVLNYRFESSISKSMLSKWENDKEEPSRFGDTVAIAKYFGVTTDFLLGISEEKYSAPKKEPLKPVPVVGTIAAGTPIFAEENIVGHEWVPEKVHVDFCLTVKGTSMIGARIFDGDTVYIQRQSDVENGEIAAVLVDNEATLKRVYKVNGTVILRPENPEFKDLVFSKKDAKEIRILGKAIFFKSEVK